MVDRQQILSVAALGRTLRKLVELIDADVAQPQGNFLNAGDSETLSFLENLHEMAGFHQCFVGPGVEPGKATAEHLDIKIATIEVGAVDVGDLDLAVR